MSACVRLSHSLYHRTVLLQSNVGSLLLFTLFVKLQPHGWIGMCIFHTLLSLLMLLYWSLISICATVNVCWCYAVSCSLCLLRHLHVHKLIKITGVGEPFYKISMYWIEKVICLFYQPTNGSSTSSLSDRWASGCFFSQYFEFPSVLWYCWLVDRRGMWPLVVCVPLVPKGSLLVFKSVRRKPKSWPINWPVNPEDGM